MLVVVAGFAERYNEQECAALRAVAQRDPIQRSSSAGYLAVHVSEATELRNCAWAARAGRLAEL